MKRYRVIPVLSCLMATSANVSAHSEGISGSGFASGLAHPITGIDHLVAMVAVGLWGAQLGGRLKWMLPVAFPIVMALGGALGIRGVPLPGVEIGIALSGLLLGLAIAAALRPPVWVAILLTGVFAIFHGYAHGKELPAAADPLAYCIGFVIATGLLHLSGISLGLIHDRGETGAKWVRAMGVGVALMGCWFVFQSLA